MNAPLADWGNFFVAQVSAAAALAGLVVVAVSINLARILSFPQLPRRAAESLVVLTGALMLASCGLIPGQPIRLFGAEVLAIGLVMVTVYLHGQVQSMPPIEGLARWKRPVRALVSAAATVPVIVGGILLVLGLDSGLYWTAVGVMVSLATGVWSAWILLIEIVR
jgi:hypothetical protein